VSRVVAACIPDWRSGPVRHSLEMLVRQRVFQIACGYEDQDDADTLRTEPLLKLVCGRLPDEADLASQPTLSRLENAVDGRDCYRLAVALVQIYLQERAHEGIPERINLDFDGTDDPAYGHQEGVAYHGYYQQHIRGSRGARGPAEDTIRCWSLMATRGSSSPPSSGREQFTPARVPSPS
jgi:Transposase DDE domain group 1